MKTEQREDVSFLKDLRSNFDTSKKFTEKQTEELLSLMNQKDIAITPTSFCYSHGFHVFQISGDFPGIEKREILCSIHHRQIPKKYAWEDFSKTYMSQRNVDLLKFGGMPEPSPDEWRYEY
jgi:hypothetical protein